MFLCIQRSDQLLCGEAALSESAGGQTVISTIVDSTPTEHSPPSTTHSICRRNLYDVKRVFRALFAGHVADGAASGTSAAALLSKLISVPDNARRRVSAAVTTSGTAPFLFKDHRQRPGQNFSAKRAPLGCFRKCCRREIS
jgi:hypothetical protein